MNAKPAAAPVCLVTGGAGAGIGSAVCLAATSAGFAVCVADIDAERGRDFVAELTDLGGDALFAEVDVSERASIEYAVERVVGQWGRIDGLVNNAGIGLVKRAADVTDGEYERLMSIDLRGSWQCARAVIPAMAEAGSGSIVNIGSIHAFGAHAGYSIYASAKAGLVGLTRGIAADYGPSGVRCNIVHPGLVDSQQNRATFSSWGVDPDEFMAELRSSDQLLPRPIDAADVANVVAFLLGDASRAITGASFVVDAGTSAMIFAHDDRILNTP